MMINLRLSNIFKILPLQFVYTLSVVIGYVFYSVFLPLRKDLNKAFSICFPDFNEKDIILLSRNHITYFIFYIFLVSVLPFLSNAKFNSMFDYSELANIIEKKKDSTNIIVVTHFFTALLITLLSDLAFDANLTLCATFEYDEALKIEYYTKKLKERFHWDYHTPIVVGGAAALGNKTTTRGQLREFLRKGEGWLIITPDVRFDKSSSDISFKVGSGEFYANRGFNFCMKSFKNLDSIIPIHLNYKSGHFKVVVSDIMSPEMAIEKYYSQVLPKQIEDELAQWQLWFMSPILMNYF
jgi:hypothetical protein